MDRSLLPNYIGRLGARFESSEKFNSESTIVNSREPAIDYAGIPMTQINKDEYALTNKELHCFIIGESGCGKTRRIILPTIHFLAKTGESMVVSDPKGEIYKKTSKMLANNGYNVFVLNFRNPALGNRWNPLGVIENLYRSGDYYAKDKAIMFLNDIANVIYCGNEGTSKDDYWRHCAKGVFLGAALLILEYGENGDITFENIVRVARRINTDIEIRNRNNNSRSSNLESSISESSILQIINNLSQTSPIRNNLAPILNNAESTRNCIMSEFEQPVSLYTGQELLMDLFSKSEIDITELGKKPTALFFVLPDDTEALYPIATVFIKQIYSSLVDLADSQQNGELPNGVTFLLDEFANFAKLPSVASMLTAARSRRIRFVLVCQSMSQLTEKYGASGQETLLSNCRVWIYMSCKNMEFIERLSKLSGQYESPYTGDKRPLVDISTLLHFKIGDVLILNDRCNPIIGHLPDYSEYNFGKNGRAEEVGFPAPHDMIERKQFDIGAAVKKSKLIRGGSEVASKNAERKAIFSDILNMTIKGRTESSVAEKTEKYDLSTIPADKSVRELFEEGQYYFAAQQCINRMGKVHDDMSTVGYLTFFIRNKKLDVTKLKADFSLNMDELLAQCKETGDDFYLINSAMQSIVTGDYAGAVDSFVKMTRIDWQLTHSFWANYLWAKKESPEGALYCMIANKLGYFKLCNVSVWVKMYEIAETEYESFLHSSEFDSIGSGKK